MSSSAAKAAYQRRHNLVARGGAKEAETVEPEPVAQPPPPKGEMTSIGPSATWAQKRKEHVLARSGGARRPSDAEIAPPPAAAAVAKKASATTEKSWQEKRKDNFLTRSMGVRPPPRKADVAVSAVVFVAKLKRLSLGLTPSPQLIPAPPLQLVRPVLLQKMVRSASSDGEVQWEAAAGLNGVAVPLYKGTALVLGRYDKGYALLRAKADMAIFRFYS